MHTKEKIMHTAIKLFSQHSTKEVSLQKIADSLGIQKAAIYYYFKTKTELMNAIMLYAQEQITFPAPSRDEIEACLEVLSPRQILLQYTLYKNDRSDYFDLLRALYRLSFHNSKIPQLIFDVFHQFRVVVFHVLKHLRGLRAIPAGDIKTLATMWTNTTLSYSILFTHRFIGYNDYYNTINFFITIAVNGVPALDTGNVNLPQLVDTPRQSPKDTKESIAYHAFRLFCLHGYEHTTMRQIAEQADMPVSGIYRHYCNKRAIMWRIMDTAQRDYTARLVTFDDLMKEVLMEKDPSLLITKFASSYLPTQGENAKQCYRLMLLEQYRDERVREFYIHSLFSDCATVETVLDSLVSQNIIPPCPSYLIARAHIFNHCALSIQSALLGRNLASSQVYRIKASAILVGAILGGTCQQ